MHKVRVGVLRGGPSVQYDTSLKTGAMVLQHLPQEFYEPQDILISRDGVWHRGGLAVPAHDILSHVDVVFNALHGHYGEDGQLQHFLERHKVPFTGSPSFSSVVGMNKSLTKDILKREGIKTPYYQILETPPAEGSHSLFRHFSPPVIIKSVSNASPFESTLVKTPSLLDETMMKAFSHGAVMVEEYIPGVLASVGVIDGYRGSSIYALPAIEAGDIVPSNFSQEHKKELEDLAKKVHKALGFRHYSHIDFIVSPRRGIFVVSASALPSLAEESSLMKSLRAVGASIGHFLDHILQLTLNKKQNPILR